MNRKKEHQLYRYYNPQNIDQAKTRAKNPNLAEAYEFFTGEPLEDHHSANKDAVAALQIYLGIQEHNEQ